MKRRKVWVTLRRKRVRVSCAKEENNPTSPKEVVDERGGG